MKNLKKITTILFCLVAFSCKKDSNSTNTTQNPIFYQNSPNSTDGLVAEGRADAQNANIYFYGTSNVNGDPEDINSISYVLNQNDTIINFILDSDKRPSIVTFSKKNGQKINTVVKYEYLPNDTFLLSVYNYDWITQTDSLVFQAKSKDSIAIKTYGLRTLGGNINSSANVIVGTAIVVGFSIVVISLAAPQAYVFAINNPRLALAGIVFVAGLIARADPNQQLHSPTNPVAPISPTSGITPSPIGTPANPGGGSVGIVRDIDGNIYNTIEIGTQTWMVENLKTSRYNDGTAIPTGLSNASWQTATSGAYAIYDNVGSNNTTYGKLYNGYAVYTGKLAPSGWHVPSDDEWQILVHYVDGGGAQAGDALKATTLWNSPNPGANNSSGFTALPAGSRNFIGQFEGIGTGGLFWTSSEDVTNTEASWFYGLFNNSRNFYRDITNKQIGYSVRCIKN